MKAFSTRHGRWTAALFTGLLVVGLGAIGRADAGEVVGGNPTCEGYDHSAKYENPSGPYEIDRDGLHLTMSIGTYPDVSEPNHDNAVLSYAVQADSDVTTGLIIVKGGSGAIVYDFDDPVPLHSPVLENGKWPTISHVQVCWNEPELPEYGRIELTKIVAGDEGPDDATPFALCISGPSTDGEPLCHKALPGDTVSFDELLPGTYAISEEDPGGNWVVTYSTESITVVAGQTGTGTVTNTWEEEPEPARIELTKAVTGEGAPAGEDFELCIVGPAPDDTSDCQLVGDGETATFEHLEPGTYTVVETDPASNWVVTYSDVTLTVQAGETGTATVTNTWEEEQQEPPTVPARISVTKAVTGDDAPAAAVFTLCITGPQPDDTPQCELVSAGQTATFENLEPGSYTVTETGLGDNWTVAYSDVTLTVEAGETGTATVTNTWEEQEQLPPTPTPPSTDVSPSGGSLPTTGSGLELTQAGIAVALLAAGSVLLRLSRRPESTTS